MKIIILFAIGTLFLICSCAGLRKQTVQTTPGGDYLVGIGNINSNLKLTVVTIDNCEYLMGMVTGAWNTVNPNTIVITHKGNCKYCVARQQAH